MRERKQNVFDDFHAAAEKLIADGWTSSSQLAVWGGSNGGLLVGASVTQRPDLSAAAVCSAPLLDMVRYERFGLGETWNDEYGTAADAEEFGWLISYSPYHHVRPGVRYPAVLFTVFDGDTRVDPLHARKMCAALQHATSAPLQRATHPAAGTRPRSATAHAHSAGRSRCRPSRWPSPPRRPACAHRLTPVQRAGVRRDSPDPQAGSRTCPSTQDPEPADAQPAASAAGESPAALVVGPCRTTRSCGRLHDGSPRRR